MYRPELIALILFFATGSEAFAQDIDRGRAIVEGNCAPCHATARDGASPLAAAPPFRSLSERYPISDLEEALAEGIVTAHPAMPEFTFEPSDVAAIIAYIQSIQAN